MKNKAAIRYLLPALVLLILAAGCKSSKITVRAEKRSVPSSYNNSSVTDTTNSADINWRQVFADSNLVALIDTALKNNQELNVTMLEINIAQNEVKARKGEYLPFGSLQLGAGVDKPGRYTRDGAVEQNLEIQPGKAFPEPLGDFMVGAVFSWELDIWGKLRNAKRAAAARYLGSIEGRNFMVTNLISEISSSYYELLALDNQLDIISKNIEIQSNALAIIRQQKEAARVSQLAVNRFEAQLLNTQNLQFAIRQRIVETENRINFLTGRFPQPVKRDPSRFNDMDLDSLYIGVPSQLLINRPDIRQAEQELAACKLDVKSARAAFYPSIRLNANIAFQAFNPAVWFNPASLLYNIFGDLMAPLINRNAIKAAYRNANARQLQAVFNYEKSILTGYTDVVNQLSAIQNYSNSYKTKAREAQILTQSVEISGNLFNSARADYMEVLLTQREALQVRMELIEVKARLLNSKVAMYKALGGGWK